MSDRTPSKAELQAMREERIYRFCQERAEQIVAELDHSLADNGEDIETLLGLMEVWQELEMHARYEQSAS